MQAALIINPTSGISSVTEKRMSPEETERTILEGLRACNIEPDIYHTTPEETGSGLARHLAEEHVELVIAAGGDGTIHAVANGLAGSDSIMGIVPTGTMNNLAHSLNIPDTIPDACTAIAKGETHTIDLGKVNDHLFLEVAGVGLEAALFPAAEEIKHPGFLSTMQGTMKGLKTLLSFKPTRLSISSGSGRRIYTALQVTICNAPFYGAHLQLAPMILMDDGLLDVIIYRDFSKLEYLRHAVSISQGRRPYQPKIQHLQLKELRIDADQPLEIQADGEVIGNTPASISIWPKALRVRVSGKPAPGLDKKGQAGELITPASWSFQKEGTHREEDIKNTTSVQSIGPAGITTRYIASYPSAPCQQPRAKHQTGGYRGAKVSSRNIGIRAARCFARCDLPVFLPLATLRGHFTLPACPLYPIFPGG